MLKYISMNKPDTQQIFCQYDIQVKIMKLNKLEVHKREAAAGRGQEKAHSKPIQTTMASVDY